MHREVCEVGREQRPNANSCAVDDEDDKGSDVNQEKQIAQQIANESAAARRNGGWNRKEHPALAGLLHAAHVAIYQRAKRSRNGCAFHGNRRLRFKHHGRLYYCRTAFPGYLVVENAVRRTILSYGPLSG